jgi:cyclic pyranopterin phosphate synthase
MKDDTRRYSLRLQVTTTCQLRCGYCRPDDFDTWCSAGLVNVEMVRAARLLSNLGVARIRLTGGEPLLCQDIVWLVARLAEIEDLEEVTLTTNGQRLRELVRPLHKAGLTRVNVHIDSLDADRYRTICGGDLGRALDGLHAAVAAKLSPKVNVVVQRGLNDHEIPAFCDLARELGVTVRFIEIMDTGIAPAFAARAFVSGSEIGARLAALGAGRVPRYGSAPAVDYRFPDGTSVGVIASETEPFCDRCDRLRLGLDGVLRTCLYAPGGLDVAALLRSRVPDPEIAERMRAHIAAKRSEHLGARGTVGLGRGFSMAAIGG